MHVQELIQQYGYLAIVTLGIFENDTTLLLGAYAAHQHYLQLPWVMACAALAVLISDHIYFYFGRRHGSTVLQRFPSAQPRMDKALRWIERYPWLSVLAIRWAFGLRAVLPLALGMSRIPLRVFTPLSLLGAGVWAIAFGMFGSFFVQWIHQWMGNFRHHAHALLAGFAVLALVALFTHGRRLRRWRKP